MPTVPLSAAVIAEVRAGLANGETQRTIATRLGIATGSVGNIKNGKISNQVTAALPELEAIDEIRGNQRDITLPHTDIQTLDQLIEHCAIDLSTWKVERWTANKWAMGAKDAAGKIITTPLFQVKATLTRKVAVADARTELDALKEQAKKAAHRPAPIRRAKLTSGNLLEISIPDAHLGKLAWGEETGGRNYDTRIAERVYTAALEGLLARAPQLKYDQIVYVVGNDLLQSDDTEGRTTSGTQVDCDGRYHKTFRIVRNMIVASIERLRQIAPVKVVMVSGNHDELSVWHLGDSLECYFHLYKDVEIDNSPRSRKYHQHGKVMLMWTHGHRGKIKEYPQLIAHEQPRMFGETRFREIHLGHRHKLEVDEQYGVRTRTLSSLCEADAWHAENGFVGNILAAEAFSWNEHEGLIGTGVYSRMD